MLILEKNYTIRTYCRTYFDNQQNNDTAGNG